MAKYYCDYAQSNPYDKAHHDEEYGLPVYDEHKLFERFCLEIMQAGLSWNLILKRRAGMHEVMYGFNIDNVASSTLKDKERYLSDARNIRNRRKIDAIIKNAKTFQELRSNGGFIAWLDSHHPLALEDWVKQFRRQFVFVGGEIVNELLMSIGYLPGAHKKECPQYEKCLAANPRWFTGQKL